MVFFVARVVGGKFFRCIVGGTWRIAPLFLRENRAYFLLFYLTESESEFVGYKVGYCSGVLDEIIKNLESFVLEALLGTYICAV